MTAYIIPIGMFPEKLVYGKDFNLQVELEHKAMSAIKKQKMDWNEAVDQRPYGLNKLDEFFLNHMKVQRSTNRR